MVLPWVYCCHIPYKACRSLKLSSPYLFTFHLQLRLRKLAYIHAARQQHTVLHLTCKKPACPFCTATGMLSAWSMTSTLLPALSVFIYSITLASSVELTNCIWPLFSARRIFSQGNQRLHGLYFVVVQPVFYFLPGHTSAAVGIRSPIEHNLCSIINAWDCPAV